MGNRRKQEEPQGRKITLKMARGALKVTIDGKQRLDLSNMGITVLPQCLLRLAHVDELDLSRNRLSTLPEYVGRFSNLRWLDLHSNQLEDLPVSIGSLQGLLYLNLCNNRLGTAGLPDELRQLGCLRSLNLGLNRLETVPHAVSALRELRELALFDNLLTQVPAYLSRLPHLRKLNTGRNPIYGPGVGDRGQDPIRRVRCFYLVDGERLCEACLGRCLAERQRLHHLGSSSGRSLGGSVYSGPVTPSPTLHDQRDPAC